jgi:membrane-bound serine protease (ClpP class)
LLHCKFLGISSDVKFRICSILAGLLALLSANATAAAPAAEAPPAKVVVIPIRSEIDQPELFILRRALKEAIAQQADTVVLDMETPGGSLSVTFEMLKALEKFPGKTLTYINREAISAGALISAGTDAIYFAPDGIIGAAAPVLAGGGDIDETTQEKIVSYLKARVRSISEGKGYRGEVISAMIDNDAELRIGEVTLKRKGELLSLTASEAMKSYGDPPRPLLGAGIAENLGALLDQVHGAGRYSVQTFEVSWSEKLAKILNRITPLLLGVGLVCLFIEFKTPGFGVFGITGISLLGVIFFGQFAAGLSGHEPALFFLLGVSLVAAELFFFPGVAIVAVVGAALMLGSLVMAMTDLWPSEPIRFSEDALVLPLVNVLAGVVLAAVLFLVLFKYLPRGSFLNRIVLDAAIGGAPVAGRALAGIPDDAGGLLLVGKTGIAATGLFPSGQVVIDEKRYEARLAVGSAAVGTPVRVVALGGFGLTVEVLS